MAMITYSQLVEKSIFVENQLIGKKYINHPIQGRFKHYQKIISLLRDNWEANTMDKFWIAFKMEDTGFALKELFEITTILEQVLVIYDSISKESKKYINEKLLTILSGPNFTIDETSKNSAARNYQFELRLASKMIEAQYKKISFAEHPDLLIEEKMRPYSFECKRILGNPERKIPSNIVEAIHQLENYKKGNYAGIVAVDLSPQFEQGKNWLKSKSREEANKFTLNQIESVAWTVYNRVYKVKEAAERGYLVGILLNLSTVYILTGNNEMGWIQEMGILILNKENPDKGLHFSEDFNNLQKYT